MCLICCSPQGNYEAAAAKYRDGGATERAVEIFRGLRMFDEAAAWGAIQPSTGSAADPASPECVTAAVERHTKARELRLVLQSIAVNGAERPDLPSSLTFK